MNNESIPDKSKKSNLDKIYIILKIFGILATIGLCIIGIFYLNEYRAAAPNLQGTVSPLIIVLEENKQANVQIEINNTPINELYMRQVGIKNEGKNDIEELRVTYELSPDGFVEDMDKNLNVFASISNSSPSPTIPIILSKSAKNSRDYYIPRLGSGEAVSVLLLFNKVDNVAVKPSAVNFNPDRDFHIRYLQ